MSEPLLINFVSHTPCIITADEYEKIRRDVITRRLMGEMCAGDRILAQLLLEHAPRYQTIKEGTPHGNGQER